MSAARADDAAMTITVQVAPALRHMECGGTAIPCCSLSSSTDIRPTSPGSCSTSHARDRSRRVFMGGARLHVFEVESDDRRGTTANKSRSEPLHAASAMSVVVAVFGDVGITADRRTATHRLQRVRDTAVLRLQHRPLRRDAKSPAPIAWLVEVTAWQSSR